jgi:hypothetical protein
MAQECSRVLYAIASTGSSVLGSIALRLWAAFASMSSPVSLVLDDVRALHEGQGRAPC